MMGKKWLFSIFFILLIASVLAVNNVGYDLTRGRVVYETTNASGNDSRFTNALGNCSAGQFISGFDSDGFKYCGTPSATGGVTSLFSANNYINLNDSTGSVLMTFNETVLNNTISARDTNCSSPGSCSNVAYMNEYANIGNFTGSSSSTNSWIKNWTGIIGRNGNLLIRTGGTLSTNAVKFQDNLGNDLLSFSGAQGMVVGSSVAFIPATDGGSDIGDISTPRVFNYILGNFFGNATNQYSIGQLAYFWENQANYYNQTQSNATYVKKEGDTVNGVLNVTGNLNAYSNITINGTSVAVIRNNGTHLIIGT